MSNLGPMGWAPRPDEVEKVMNSLPHPVFEAIGASIKGSGKGKVTLLYDFIRQANGGRFPNRKQTVGDCVSQGAAYAVDAVKAVDIVVNGDFELWVAETATEDIYGGSRVQIGNGRIGRGDGSIGAWAARYVSEYGAVPRGKYGNVDLTTYSGQKAQRWGMPSVGVPATLIKKAKQHPIETVSQISTYAECRDLVANGYGVTIASNQGFSNRRDSEGFARPEGSWAHQMCATKETVIKGFENKEIQQVSTGDLVYDQNGDLQKVTEVFVREYSGDIIKLNISGRGFLELTPNHPVLVFSKVDSPIEVFNTVDIPLYANKDYKSTNKNPSYDLKKRVCKWVNAEDVSVDDWVMCPRPSVNNKSSTEKWVESKRCRRQPRPIIMNDKFSWFLGLYAADGGVSKGHKITITCNKKDAALIDSCTKFINEELGLNATIKSYKNAIRVICYSSVVANTFYEWFNTGKNKRIPRFVIDSCDHESFIKGFVDGDGSIINDGEAIKIVNCNKFMIEDLHTMLLSLQHSPYINKLSYKDKTYGNENWSDKYEICWSLNIKKETNWWSESNFICRIKNVETKTLTDKVYNLEVENTHTYIANGIVVHNCILAVDDAHRRPGVLVQNSWGTWNAGPKRHNQPDGSFWVDADDIERLILSQGDSWAFSGYAGFKPQQLNTRII
mgnify:CR=1 FL=1|jgi:intein/homing endonuclease